MPARRTSCRVSWKNYASWSLTLACCMRERIVVPPRCPWHWRLWNRPASKWRPSPLRGLLWTMFIFAMPGARFAKPIREAPVESAHTFLLYDAAPLSELDAPASLHCFHAGATDHLVGALWSAL